MKSEGYTWRRITSYNVCYTKLLRGVPNFISAGKLGQLREGILERLKKEKTPISAGGPFGDTLIVLLVDARNNFV